MLFINRSEMIDLKNHSTFIII